MIRGFGRVVARQGFGFGATALALTFRPVVEQEDANPDLAQQLTADLRNCVGIVSAVVLRPESPPSMTREQALRGPDKGLPRLLTATGCDRAAFERFAVNHSTDERLAVIGLSLQLKP